jgi:hypothetical protein
MKLLQTVAFAALVVVAGEAASAPEQVVTGPVAEYWMRASTASGMGGMGGGGRPDMRAMMSGGYNPNAVTHSLVLQLGTERKPQGDPSAEHDPPEGLGAGPMLPLVTPQAQPTHEEGPPSPPPQYQQPRGRMLIFWGCGEHAGPGQPYVIDFAKLGQGAGGQQFMALGRGLAVSPMQPPSPARNATYGEWPNAQSRTSVPGDGSLQGDHTVRGDYTPDIHFSLTADQDFLPPVQMITNQRNPSGSASLGWRHVDGAQGYFATMFGAQSQDQIVMWTSSAAQASSFGLPQYLSDGEIARLVAAHVLMPASQTDCTIPVEAVSAAGRGGFYNFVAYGGETNLSYPARPPAPQPWHILWRVKVRYRASTGGMVGMDMSQMMGGHGDQGEGQDQQQQQQQEQHRPNPFNPFGGVLP